MISFLIRSDSFTTVTYKFFVFLRSEIPRLLTHGVHHLQACLTRDRQLLMMRPTRSLPYTLPQTPPSTPGHRTCRKLRRFRTYVYAPSRSRRPHTDTGTRAFVSVLHSVHRSLADSRSFVTRHRSLCRGMGAAPLVDKSIWRHHLASLHSFPICCQMSVSITVPFFSPAMFLSVSPSRLSPSLLCL